MYTCAFLYRVYGEVGVLGGTLRLAAFPAADLYKVCYLYVFLYRVYGEVGVLGGTLRLAGFPAAELYKVLYTHNPTQIWRAH
jgi:hypothetical protein